LIQICTCKCEMQDKIHGKNMRVKNYCKKNSAVRCTVCLKESTVQSKVEVKKEEKEKK